MSLMRFLTATRSIKGSHDEPSPYRLPQENLLPKFGSPARGRTRAQEDKTDRALKVSDPGAPKPSEAQKDLSATAQTKARAMEGKRTWMFWRNWFAPKPQKAVPVQAEFALDGVRVVRNDLVDADLELVTKKAKRTDVTQAVAN